MKWVYFSSVLGPQPIVVVERGLSRLGEVPVGGHQEIQR
jgi:hypothetical protein